MADNNESEKNCSLAEPAEIKGEAAVHVGSAAAVAKQRANYSDLQSAPRFPIKLPISLKSKSGESLAETQNISANGVLFQVDSDIPVGSLVDFTISLPAQVMGVESDVQLDCRGRVVRSFEDGGRRDVGVVIDEYRFERR
ncbi:MAG: PilZ domain-containing protein [Acidobacteriota bacterium]|jgi:hypothetical protein|nr:PilZ domain-containing protein [Acidobacteriota bacterium]